MLNFRATAVVLLIASMLTTALFPSDGAEPIRVMTYNVRYANPGDGEDVWTNRVDAVADAVAEADLIGLQEVLDSQLQDLDQRLEGYDHYGVGRDDGQREGEYSPIFFRTDRIEVLDRGTFWLSESPTEIGSVGWDAAITRICSWIVARDKRTGAEFWFGNTHFDHVGQQARGESAKLITNMAARLSRSRPSLLVGDFNSVPGSLPYQSIIDPTVPQVLVDARERVEPRGPNSTWNGFREIISGRVIDHLFVSPSVEVLSLAVLDPKTAAGRFASDHLPVLATLRLPAK